MTISKFDTFFKHTLLTRLNQAIMNYFAPHESLNWGAHVCTLWMIKHSHSKWNQNLLFRIICWNWPPKEKLFQKSPQSHFANLEKNVLLSRYRPNSFDINLYLGQDCVANQNHCVDWNKIFPFYFKARYYVIKEDKFYFCAIYDNHILLTTFW